MSETSVVKRKNLDPVGLRMYGDTFAGFQKIGDFKDLIASFKDYYYSAKIKNPNETLSGIVQGFNTEVCIPLQRKFHPSGTQLRTWRKKWDLDLMQQMQDKDLVIASEKDIHQVIKTRNEENQLVLGGASDGDLEAGVRTLGGELLNDAMQMLRDDQALEEIYDDETLIKRRNYVVNVFSHATKLVHGKAALLLKASEEKRNSANFMMSLLARSSAGKMTDEDMAILKGSYTNNEQLKSV